MKQVLAALLLTAACSSSDDGVIAPAPPSRHASFADALDEDARGYTFEQGDWLDDLGDAEFYGIATLARRTDLTADDAARLDQALTRARALLAEDLVKGDLQEKVMAALGLIDRIAVTKDRSDVVLLDSFVDRLDSLVKTFGDYLSAAASESWAIQTYGPTAVTALVAIVEAQYAYLIGGDRAGDRRDRAVTIEATITAKALTDLVDAPTGRSTRGYATDIDLVGLDLYPNVAMLILEGRLFELTRNETYRLQARAIYAAIQPLKISDAPARYASPYAADGLKVGPHDVATLSSQGYLALALSILYEITGETRFIDEVDRVFDALEAMRGPWCVADVHAGETCTPACGPATSVCADTYCVAPTCSTGLLHHVVQGRLAQPSDGTFYCAGCNFEARYVIGYRRVLAGESF